MLRGVPGYCESILIEFVESYELIAAKFRDRDDALASIEGDEVAPTVHEAEGFSVGVGVAHEGYVVSCHVIRLNRGRYSGECEDGSSLFIGKKRQIYLGPLVAVAFSYDCQLNVLKVRRRHQFALREREDGFAGLHHFVDLLDDLDAVALNAGDRLREDSAAYNERAIFAKAWVGVAAACHLNSYHDKEHEFRPWPGLRIKCDGHDELGKEQVVDKISGFQAVFQDYQELRCKQDEGEDSMVQQHGAKGVVDGGYYFVFFNKPGSFLQDVVAFALASSKEESSYSLFAHAVRCDF